jgi:glycosyltransferase involved in cell wall biosynthesis
MSVRRKTKQSTISVVLPLLNEAAVLPRLLSELKHILASVGCKWNIVLVNDGSTDGSAELLDAMAFGDKRLKVIHLSRNFGQQAAVQAGLIHAQGDAVILMDSDGQDDPAAIPEMIRRWAYGDDVVYAVRFGRKENIFKRVLFRSFYNILHGIASVAIPRNAGNFGLIDRRVADILIQMDESDRYFPGLRSWVGFKQTALRVERFARHDRCPRKSLRSSIGIAKNALVGFSRVPLQAFYGLAAFSAVVCTACIVFALFLKLVVGGAVPGWASITIITSFFGAMNALGIAVLSEYISRIYDQVRKRPEFVIAKSTNLVDEIARESVTAISVENMLLAELNSLRLEIERLQGNREASQRPYATAAADENVRGDVPTAVSHR